MHYASAYGTTREVLEVLLQNYPESITRGENKGRNPLHLAMVNAHRNSSPEVVGFLLGPNTADIINTYDDDNSLPVTCWPRLPSSPPRRFWSARTPPTALSCTSTPGPRPLPTS